jgi:hypothetical protein
MLSSAPRPKDDRGAENMGYASSGLVHPGLSSRGGREQSAPPALNRNMFPPTPPPDDKLSAPTTDSGTGMTGRAASVRTPAHRPPALQRIGTNTSDASKTSNGMERGPPSTANTPNDTMSPRARIGTVRTASEPRGPSGWGSAPPPKSGRLYGETTEESMTDLYDMYQTQGGPKNTPSNRMGGNRRQPAFIDEGDEYSSGAYDRDNLVQNDGVDFEIVGGPGGIRSAGLQPRATPRQPMDVKKFRVKVHSQAEIRYILIGSSIDIAGFENKVRDKFGLKGRLRVQMRDDGDMVTMGDQDDLDTLIESAKSEAQLENRDMGKIEVSDPLCTSFVFSTPDR